MKCAIAYPRIALCGWAFCLAAVTAVAPPAFAQSVSAPTAPKVAASEVDPVRYEAAYSLAKLLRSEESILAENARTYEPEILKQITASPAFAPLEKQHPGIVAHMFIAARPVAERQTIASLPKLWARLATLLASEMTLVEIEQTRAYYVSPAGRRLIAWTIRNYDMKPAIEAMGKDPEARTDPETMRRGVTNVATPMIREMSAADRVALAKFGATAAGTKLARLNTRILEIKAAWADESLPEDELEMETVMRTAMEAFASGKLK